MNRPLLYVCIVYHCYLMFEYNWEFPNAMNITITIIDVNIANHSMK